MELERLREEINKIDENIISLINERVALALDIGKIKEEGKISTYSPEREKEIFERIEKLNKGKKFPTDVLINIYKEIISATRALEAPIKVAYLGPEASYTHLAVMRQFGSSIDGYPVQTISDIFRGVETGKFDFGVVPVENSYEGVVTHTLDMFVDSSLNICSELYLNITHNLVSNCNSISEIRKLYTHPQPLAQCRIWIQNNLPNIEIIETSSSAKAASLVPWDKYSAAIASEVAAHIHNLNILARGIEDSPENYTRFLVIGNIETQPSGNDKTSIIVSIADKPGALHKLLEPFASRGINMTKIESRPSKKKAWQYLFFIDLDGHKMNSNIAEAFDDLKDICTYFKVLGSYPKGRVFK